MDILRRNYFLVINGNEKVDKSKTETRNFKWNSFLIGERAKLDDKMLHVCTQKFGINTQGKCGKWTHQQTGSNSLSVYKFPNILKHLKRFNWQKFRNFMVSENSFDFMTTSCRFLVKIYHRKKLPPTFYDWYMPWYVWLFQEERGRLPLLGIVCPPLGIPSTEKKQTNKVRMIRCCVRQVVINMLYNIASKFV